MKVLGIDPGTGRTGFGVIEGSGNSWKMIECGLIETRTKAPASQRLDELFGKVQAVLRDHQPDEVAVEELFFTKNVTTGLGVAQSRGVILLAVEQAGLPVAEYKPQQVKQSVSAYGGAGKAQVATMVTKLLNLKKSPTPDDVTDALAVALCHAGWSKLSR